MGFNDANRGGGGWNEERKADQAWEGRGTGTYWILIPFQDKDEIKYAPITWECKDITSLRKNSPSILTGISDI